MHSSIHFVVTCDCPIIVIPSKDSIGIKVFMPSLYFATHLLPSIPMSAPFSFTYSRLTYSSPFHRFVTIKLRPLTGYLISKFALLSLYLREKVSVPSRGILFPNKIKEVHSNDADVSFPSPLGVSYFQIRKLKKPTPTTSFFPSPLGAPYFQIYPTLKTVISSRLSPRFRPLSGYLISK